MLGSFSVGTSEILSLACASMTMSQSKDRLGLSLGLSGTSGVIEYMAMMDVRRVGTSTIFSLGCASMIMFSSVKCTVTAYGDALRDCVRLLSRCPVNDDVLGTCPSRGLAGK